MKIATFNTNGIRPRVPIILKWLEKEKPDALCVQETKAQDKDFPNEAFTSAGYNTAFKGQKSYNGVAIISKTPMKNITLGFGDGDELEEPRIIKAEINGIPIVNTYCPQGFEPESEKFQYKLKWFERLLKYFKKHYKPEEPLIWVGDFNVAPEDIDIYDPEGFKDNVCLHPKARKALDNIKSWGVVDVFRLHDKRAEQYTFWDYRIPNAAKRKLGWRLDHIWATKPLAEKSTRGWIDIEPRLNPKPSDHTFLIAEFEV